MIDRMRVILSGAHIATAVWLRDTPHITDHFDAVDPMLTLEGLRIVSERNK
ncbi:MAG: hypothetical protein R2849_00655 [Thermomicrobiales bacterium]